MKIATFTTLYPSAARPNHGVFVETRLRHLVASGGVDARVVAPVPWFPSTHPRFRSYATMARTPAREQRNGIEIVHPRYPLPPKIGMSVAPFALASAGARALSRLRADGFDFELIDAHYFYPDGVAAILAGRWLDRPVVITARGTDLNLIPRYALPRRMIRWAAQNAAGVVTVCAALKDVLIDLGIDAARIDVLRNGVDLELFRPIDREQGRADLGFTGRTLVSVGFLTPRKGHDIAIRAMRQLSDTQLVVIGDGEQLGALKSLALQCGVSDRVRFVGAMPQSQLRDYYGAADALVLMSDREGWANVLLESMACGTPVVATNVWGTPEVVAAPEAGLLVDERTPEALAEAAGRLFANPPDRAATRRYAERFSWDATTAGQLQLFRRVLETKPTSVDERPSPSARPSAKA
jgi:glycosyltransferase involved in cell wall biosynthesis